MIGGQSVTPDEVKEKVIEIVCEQMGVDREKVTPIPGGLPGWENPKQA